MMVDDWGLMRLHLQMAGPGWLVRPETGRSTWMKIYERIAPEIQAGTSKHQSERECQKYIESLKEVQNI
jgi:hypothetical protein